MGKALRLEGITLTDATAPLIPHAAGVAGYNRRFWAAAQPGAAGDLSNTWRNLVVGGADLVKDARPLNATLEDQNGIRGVRLPGIPAGYGPTTLSGDPGSAANITMAAVVRKATGTPMYLRANGYQLTAFGDTSSGLQAIGTGATGLIGPAVIANDTWGLVIGVGAGAASAAYVNGNKGTGALTPGTNTLTVAAGDGSLVAEFITWPFAFTDAQAAAVRVAMRAKYAALP